VSCPYAAPDWRRHSALGAYPFYAPLNGHALNIIVLMTVAALAGAFVNGTFAFVTADLFPTRIRFSGVAVVQNISQTAFGGTAPLVATALVRSLQSPVTPALIVAVCGILTFAGTFAVAAPTLVIERRGQRGSAQT
jgi:MFS transporter, MHS family, proline/betaine transporter